MRLLPDYSVLTDWRAVCRESGKHGSGRDGWKSAHLMSNSLAVYSTLTELDWRVFEAFVGQCFGFGVRSFGVSDRLSLTFCVRHF